MMLTLGRPGCGMLPCRNNAGVVVLTTVALMAGSGAIRGAVRMWMVPVCDTPLHMHVYVTMSTAPAVADDAVYQNAPTPLVNTVGKAGIAVWPLSACARDPAAAAVPPLPLPVKPVNVAAVGVAAAAAADDAKHATRTRTTVSGFTQLGLVEMTRKRTRESLAHMLCAPCPTCDGRGQVKTARTVCYDILREILREARQFSPREFRVVAHPSVVETLLDEESVHLAGLSEFIGKPISLSTEPTSNPEHYDIVLM